ncbi:hypothetical protein [Photorhabdus heterorhabditis]|uniref:hypothetical protein n=1 Tax=Photorhabdus heterorhabditis TaxID=880156 RepID=UPI00156252F7|nr:hypothetical protein [Photorhabdus heterorhabditis]NRN28956.1 hypothetical protein [Photorhabdus heterorhabditis subsp. aluminescens]
MDITTRNQKIKGYIPSLLLARYYIPVIFQVASLLAALTHPGHRVIYAPGDSFLAVAMHLEIYWV